MAHLPSAHIDQAVLGDALRDADIRVLLMVLFHLTGDSRWLEPPYQPARDIRLFPDESAGLDADLQAHVRHSALTLLSTGVPEPAVAAPSEELLLRMMSHCLGETVPQDYAPMAREEMGLATTTDRVHTTTAREDNASFSTLIIGAGVSGLCAAMTLHRMGLPFTVLERNSAVGGTWFENTYPDCGVDTPNHFYSYSFAPNHEWSQYFAPQPEIRSYLERCVDESGIRKHIRLGITVLGAQWDEHRQAWTLTFDDGRGDLSTLSANAVICAVGQLNRPAYPDIRGVDQFRGPAFHTARWKHDINLEGKRVAVIGTGASAMQLVPEVARRAQKLSIFQRSPQWARPVDDYHRAVSEGTKWLLSHVPFYATWYRFLLLWRYGDGLHRTLVVDPDWPHPERSVSRANDRHRAELVDYTSAQLDGDPDLLARTLPDYPPYGKRMLVDNGWFRTLRRPNVALITDPIDHVDEGHIITAAGEEHPVDVIVMATGFQARDPLGDLDIRGREGRTVASQWGQDDPRAYLGIAIPGFPNLFVMYGPNTNLAHGGSIIFHAECQMRYIEGLLELMLAHSVASVEVRADVHDEYNDAVDDAHRRMVWAHPRVSSWYRNRAGRVVANSPWRLVDYWHLTRWPTLDDYVVTPASEQAAGRTDGTPMEVPA